MRKPRSYDSVDDALAATARLYRRNLWRDAGEYVEVWSEKDALAGVIYPVTANHDVPLMVARGFVVGEGEGESLFKDAAGVIAECIQASSVEERGDQGLMTEKLRVELRRFFKKRSGRRRAWLLRGQRGT